MCVGKEKEKGIWALSEASILGVSLLWGVWAALHPQLFIFLLERAVSKTWRGVRGGAGNVVVVYAVSPTTSAPSSTLVYRGKSLSECASVL